MFTVFANFRIHSPERVQRLSECLTHLARAKSRSWVFNIRGDYQEEAAHCIRALAPGPLHISHLDSENGWFADTLQLLQNVDAPFLVFAIEDHFLMGNPLLLERTVQEMHDLNIDHLEYSWFPSKSPHISLTGIEQREGSYTRSIELNLRSNIQRHINFSQHLGYNGSIYSISMASIIRTSLLHKVCAAYHPERRRFDARAPFDAERSGCDVDIFPLRVGHPKMELFAALDDDNIHPGVSLHNRGLYERYATREQLQTHESSYNWLYQDLKFLVPNQISKHPDCTVQLRIYRYVPQQLELQNNLAQVAGTQMQALAEALRIDQSIVALTDYESQAGCMSVFFLKAFGGNWCSYRSADDLQAVRAHENIFSNRIFAGFKVGYLEQRVSLGEHVVEDGFRIYADYTPLGPCLKNAGVNQVHAEEQLPMPTGGRLIYANMTRLPAPTLCDSLRTDLGSKDVRVVISDSVRLADQGWSEPAMALNQWLAHQGFALHATSDFVVHPGDEDHTVDDPLRRCAVYLRQTPH